MIKALVVDDSLVVQRLISRILTSDPEIEVIGMASDGQEAVRLVDRLRPNVVTMDIHMPRMDGFEATRQIMQTNPIPIVIVSALLHPDEERRTQMALDAGAVASAEKPAGPDDPRHERLARQLVRTVKLMAEVKVVKRRPWMRTVGRQGRPSASETDGAQVVAIGASTGGPIALQAILSALPADFPLPLLAVQHITSGFTLGLVEWLNESTPLQVRAARDGERAEPGNCYIAPDGFHMKVDRGRGIHLTTDPLERSLRPSVSYLLRSVRETFGPKAIGVLLTGMGVDGAAELKDLRDAGATTIAQDEESSVIYGMPGEAVKLDGATHVLPLSEIADTLTRLVSKR